MMDSSAQATVRRAPRLDRLAGPAVFAGAFLLLAVQPLAAKRMLPVYGGSSSVWTVSLLFFQLTLLGGYAWAHFVRHRPRLHAAMTILAAGSLYFFASPVDHALGSPILGVLAGLAQRVGLPYFVLSATSPLLQAWTKEYRLYAFSNLGSLAGLVGFVFVLDRIESIAQIFVVAYVVFAALIVACCLAHPVAEDRPVPEGLKLSFGQVALWMLLALCGTGMLAATTNQLCQEVASIPLLWVWPLGLYLASFAICFESPRWYKRVWFGRLAAVLIPAACIVTPMGTDAPFLAHFAIDSAAFFVCLMLVHGELAERRPEEGLLTSFYLALAGGGALGTTLVAFVAPRVFTSYLEFPLFLMLAGLTPVLLWWRERLMPTSGLIPLALGALVPIAYLQNGSGAGPIMAEMRNFYGVVRVTIRTDPRGTKLVLTHGQTTHGTEYIAEKLHPQPSTYYTAQSGVGMAIGEHRRDGRPMDIGVIGLGAGTLASYAKPGDGWWFYEINPDVIRLSHEPFTYLRIPIDTAQVHIQVVEGDGRLGLTRQTNVQFDILVVDAFSSDSIPVHLLTSECGKLYRSRLKEDGILAVHISNRTLDLEPVVRGMALSNGMAALRINNSIDNNAGVSAASWMLLSPSKGSLEGLRRASVEFEKRRPIIWRDGYADIIDVIGLNE
jgi:hypothetical protein